MTYMNHRILITPFFFNQFLSISREIFIEIDFEFIESCNVFIDVQINHINQLSGTNNLVYKKKETLSRKIIKPRCSTRRNSVKIGQTNDKISFTLGCFSEMISN